MKLVFASNNAHKLKEVKAKLPSNFEVLSLKDVLGEVDIIEDGATLEENAAIKARYVYNETGLNCFADDTGLEITALNGEPGVYSARYAGEDCSFDDNMNKVLQNLKNAEDRSAKFRTVICLIIDGKESLFAGEVEGVMTEDKRGGDGFGYDPIFLPDGFSESFAEMSLDQKNQISHRGRAVEKLVNRLAQLA
ncbi:MAG: XTP/dITP diphosphohydrolase [Bacteroidia bacterium]|jgi:XTP/dITP diphosphohydrolase